MKRKRLIALAIALGSALIAGLLLAWYVAGADQRAQQAVAPRPVFIATTDIAAGTALGDAVDLGLLVVRDVPASMAPPTATTDVNDANRGYVATTEIKAGEFVLLSRFGSPTSTTNGLRIPAGLVAMSFSVGRLEHVGQYVGPGSVVTVYSTPADAEKPTVNLMTDITVLAVDATVDAAGVVTGDPMYTVAVTREQARALVSALDKGAVYLALSGEAVK